MTIGDIFFFTTIGKLVTVTREPYVNVFRESVFDFATDCGKEYKGMRITKVFESRYIHLTKEKAMLYRLTL